MQCPNCGAELPAGAKFCMSCGAAISSASTDHPAAASASIATTSTPTQVAVTAGKVKKSSNLPAILFVVALLAIFGGVVYWHIRSGQLPDGAKAAVASAVANESSIDSPQWRIASSKQIDASILNKMIVQGGPPYQAGWCVTVVYDGAPDGEFVVMEQNGFWDAGDAAQDNTVEHVVWDYACQ